MSKRFALIGHPVAGSLSPVLFRAAYNGAYGYDLIDEESFADAWARAQEYDGFNVTAPFKTLVPAMMPRCDAPVLLSGCANTVLPGQCCYNTDIDGVLGALADGGFDAGGGGFAGDAGLSAGCGGFAGDGGLSAGGGGFSAGDGGFSAGNGGFAVGDGGSAGGFVSRGRAIVVGSGGAALAAWAALSPSMEVTFVARSPQRVQHLLDASRGTSFVPIGTALPEADVLVYTLPSTAPVPPGLPLSSALVLEAEYKRPQLASLCPRYISGRRWLLHQAVRAYTLFTGDLPNLPAMESAL